MTHNPNQGAGDMTDTPCGNREYCGRHPFCGCGSPSEEERDEDALHAFTGAMREKLAEARAKGRGGWHNPAVCSLDALRMMLREHLLKGDPVDVANFAMFLHQRGAATNDGPNVLLSRQGGADEA